MVKLKLWQAGSFLCINVALWFDHQSYMSLPNKHSMNHKENCANSRGLFSCIFFFRSPKMLSWLKKDGAVAGTESYGYGASLLYDTDIWAVCLSPNSIKILQKSWWKGLESIYKSKTHEFECPDIFLRDEKNTSKKWTKNKNKRGSKYWDLGNAWKFIIQIAPKFQSHSQMFETNQWFRSRV